MIGCSADYRGFVIELIKFTSFFFNIKTQSLQTIFCLNLLLKNSTTLQSMFIRQNICTATVDVDCTHSPFLSTGCGNPQMFHNITLTVLLIYTDDLTPSYKHNSIH